MDLKIKLSLKKRETFLKQFFYCSALLLFEREGVGG